MSRTSHRSHLSHRLPIVAGSLIAAAGLALGGGIAASAHNLGANQPAGPTAVDREAAQVAAQDALVPLDGNREDNVGVVEQQIKNYYGSAPANYPGIGDVTVPAADSNYAKQLKGIVAKAEQYLTSPQARTSRGAKPAVVFDIDDTLLNTYDYELASQFGYNATVNAQWVEAGAFPAVPGSVGLYQFAQQHGYTVFFITGRPESQRAATERNLASAGFGTIDDSKLFLKQTTPPSYLSCKAVTTCTTVEYKSGTRAHLESEGYQVVADFGDQYSDLTGAAHGEQFKLPNPMYYLP